MPAAVVTFASGARSAAGSGVLVRSGMSAAPPRAVKQTAINGAAMDLRYMRVSRSPCSNWQILHQRRHGQLDSDPRSMIGGRVEQQIGPQHPGASPNPFQAKMPRRNVRWIEADPVIDHQ